MRPYTTLCFLFLITFPFLLFPRFSSADNLFGMREIRSSKLGSFPKWTSTLERYAHTEITKGACSMSQFNSCHKEKLGDFLNSLKKKEAYTQLERVNRYVNGASYIIDPINWGVPDYWATPYQFYIKDGDCEDYAISKFMALRDLGWSNDQMRIVVLKDENLGIIHAVLAVYLHSRIFILDNQVNQILEDKSIHHYTPLYSINERHWWRHL